MVDIMIIAKDGRFITLNYHAKSDENFLTPLLIQPRTTIKK